MSETKILNNYIRPNITKYSSFKELDEAGSLHRRYDLLMKGEFSFKDVFFVKRSFIVAEPGYGKTRLLKEIIICAGKEMKQGIFVDLKRADKDKDLPNFIQEKSVTADNINKIFTEERMRRSSFFKTNSFTLKDSEETIVCLDALDEVSQQDFSRVVDRIKEFSKQYENIHLFISCRLHHLKKYQELFIDTDFSYIQIASFSRSQTHDYLEKHGLSKDDIEKMKLISEERNSF